MATSQVKATWTHLQYQSKLRKKYNEQVLANVKNEYAKLSEDTPASKLAEFNCNMAAYIIDQTEYVMKKDLGYACEMQGDIESTLEKLRSARIAAEATTAATVEELLPSAAAEPSSGKAGASGKKKKNNKKNKKGKRGGGC
ncbi:hypothetical protein OQA88_7062 [Cercophora sp. LCS_1]